VPRNPGLDDAIPLGLAGLFGIGVKREDADRAEVERRSRVEKELGRRGLGLRHLERTARSDVPTAFRQIRDAKGFAVGGKWAHTG
jgi:hypothetical protein